MKNIDIFKGIIWPVVRTLWPVGLVALVAYIVYRWVKNGGLEQLYWEIVVALDERKARRGK